MGLITSNVTGRHRGPKRKLRAAVACTAHFGKLLIFSYVAPPGECYYNTLLRDALLCEHCHSFHHQVWYRALSLRYACIRSLVIILIPWATFVPNFISFTVAIAELAHGEKLRTHPLNHPAYLMRWELKLSLGNNNNNKHICE